MKRILLTTAAVACLLGIAAPARAQIPVTDVASIAQLLSQLQQLKETYTATMGVFGSLVRAVDPNSMATGLIGQQPLPGGSQIGQMLTGGGNFGPLSGLATQYMQANTAYQPQSFGTGDFNASYLQRNGNSLAGVQAMAQQSIQSIQTHIAGLTQIQSQLSTVKTDADVSAIQGRLQAEQANLSAQGVQAQSLQTMMAAQQAQYQLQAQQRARQAADETVTYYGGSSSATPSTTTVPTFNGSYNTGSTTGTGFTTSPTSGSDTLPTSGQNSAPSTPSGSPTTEPAALGTPQNSTFANPIDISNVVGGDGQETNIGGNEFLATGEN